ncbi:MAG: sulfotransferase [Candidatus Binatia bacterium]|nr:sulfotransferase [Candidatus Binatia bacterium]
MSVAEQVVLREPSASSEPMEERLIFVLSPPRSGSTLLMRMLAAHSQIYSRPEPHILPPLAHLGYFDTVDAAPFDHLQAAQAIREFVADLPRGEADYVDACRAYTDVLYGRMLAARGAGKRYFLDKTPANALVLPFIARLYPRARYIVLLRHPAAIFASYANSFFDGDYVAAQRFNPILDRYVPAIARFLRERAVPMEVVRYEILVQQPEEEMRRLCGFLAVPYEPSMIEYGRHEFAFRGLGDPLTVQRQSRPIVDSVDKWAHELAGDSRKFAFVRGVLEGIDDRDLETWGFARPALFAAVERARGTGVAPTSRPPRWDRFLLERKLLRWSRKLVHGVPGIEGLVRGLRLLCDVLLRG